MPGFLAGLRVRLEDGDGVVALANTTATPALRALGDDLLDALAELGAAAASSPGRPRGDPALLELVGHVALGPARTTARVGGEHLVLGEPGTAPRVALRRVGDDEWVGLDGYHTGEPLRVVRRADGTVSHLDLASFRFTRTPYDPGRDVPGGVDDLGWH